MQDCNENRPYELMLRWDELTGELKGAAFYERKVTVIGGELVRNELQPPQPVDAGAPALSGLIDTASAAAMATVVRLRGELDALQGVVGERDASILALTASLEKANQTISELESELAASVPAPPAA